MKSNPSTLELTTQLAVALTLEEPSSIIAPTVEARITQAYTTVVKRVLALATDREAYTTQEIEEACAELRYAINSGLEGVVMGVRKYKGEVE